MPAEHCDHISAHINLIVLAVVVTLLLFVGTNTETLAAAQSGLFIFSASDGIALTSQYSNGTNPLILWKTLEPSEGVYDWSALDAVINASAAAGKKSVPRVYTNMDGLAQASPGWFFATSGAQYYYGSQDAQNKGYKAPVAWDPVFKAKFGAFLLALGQRYDGNPAIEFFQTNAGGQLYGEMTASLEGIQPPGYTADVQIAATRYWVDKWSAAFPRTHLSLMVNYIGGNIGEDGSAYAASKGVYLQQNSPNLGTGPQSLFKNNSNTKIVVEIENGGCVNSTGSAFTNMVNNLFNMGFPIDYLMVCGSTLSDPATAATLPSVISRLRSTDKSVVVWRPANGTWYGKSARSGSVLFETQWGLSGDVPVPARYTGGATWDLAVWRPANGVWYRYNGTASGLQTQWGLPGDTPVPADFNGDGKSDFAVWRPANGVWYVKDVVTGNLLYQTQWGLLGDVPISADFNGDGKSDFAVWRPANGVWYVKDVVTGNLLYQTQWGLLGDVPISADFNGDGKSDFAVWRPANGVWYVKDVVTGNLLYQTQWGLLGDVPVSADFNGDGRADFAVWRPANGVWYVKDSLTGNVLYQTQWGLSGDTPK